MPTPPLTFRATIDRIDGDLAVLVPADRALPTFTLPHALLPGAREGQAWSVALTPDPAAGAALEADVRALQADLAKKDDGGDFSL